MAGVYHPKGSHRMLLTGSTGRKNLLQTFSMGSFPDGCVKCIQQIWELFHLVCQVFAAWLQHLIRSHLKPYAQIGFVLGRLCARVSHAPLSPLQPSLMYEVDCKWKSMMAGSSPALFAHLRSKWNRNTADSEWALSDTTRRMNERKQSWEKLKFCSMLLYLSKYETILAFSRISRRFYCSAVSGFNV